MQEHEQDIYDEMREAYTVARSGEEQFSALVEESIKQVKQ